MGMTTAGSKEINVTPLIDVLLVLLIIFMVMVPIMTRIVPVDVPPRLADTKSYEEPIIVKLHGDLTISIDNGPVVPIHELASLRPRTMVHGDPRAVFVDAEAGLPWTEVVDLVDRINGLGSFKVAVRIHDGVEP
jgi:biopolymer transport protein ExbD